MFTETLLTPLICEAPTTLINVENLLLFVKPFDLYSVSEILIVFDPVLKELFKK
jgi:hypothetical protein